MKNRLSLSCARADKAALFLNCISLIHGIADNKGETDIVTITSILSDYNDSAQKTPAVRKNVRG